jgi:hypothetical protein
MSYFPGSPTGGPGASQPNFGAAIALGVLAAIVSAFVVGVLSGLINIQFAYGAILIGFAVGATMRRHGRIPAMGLASAVVALVGSALSSVVAYITSVVDHQHVPLSYVMGHLNLVFHYLPHYIGVLGFLFWVLAAWIGWASVSCRGRRYGGVRTRGYRGANQPYGASPYGAPSQYGNAGPYGSGSPYGAPAGPGQPYGTPSGPGGQPYFGQQPDGGPGYGTPGQQPGQQGYDSSGYSGPGFAMPQDQPPGQNPQQGS